jgi:hypothetical protein
MIGGLIVHAKIKKCLLCGFLGAVLVSLQVSGVNSVMIKEQQFYALYSVQTGAKRFIAQGLYLILNTRGTNYIIKSGMEDSYIKAKKSNLY